MKLTDKETAFFFVIIYELCQHEKLQEMSKFIQHGRTTTLIHCITVAYYSYWLTRKLRWRMDCKSLIRGAMLHDFYLYDWHIPDKSHKLHGFIHPALALKNSRKYFKLNKIEEDIIEKHMWPLTLTRIPRCREAALVCLIDKCCSLAETFNFYPLPKSVLGYVKLNFMHE